MRHCYIFDYSTSDIYHTELPKSISTNEEIESYLHNLGFELDCIHYLITKNQINIIEI